MKKTLLLLFTLFLPIMASAYDAEIDGIYYNFSGNMATVTFRNYFTYYYFSDYTGAVVIPSTVSYNGKTHNVTCIDIRAFSGCSGLTSVTIPNSVTLLLGYYQYCRLSVFVYHAILFQGQIQVCW